ncbi:MAG: hypothetical protein AB1505_21265, partial [Candidatus Latescibacterota bacterium]
RLVGEGSGFTTGRTAYTDSSLTAGGLYFYQVSAVTRGGESGRSVFVSGRAEADRVAPRPPADLAAIADPSAARITVSWSAPTLDGNGGELTGLSAYIISRSRDTAAGLVAIDTVAAGQTRFVDTGLQASTTYFYAVSALDPSGNTSALSSAVSAHTAGIAPPASVAAEGGIGRVTVGWEASTAEDLRGYNVYRSTRSDQGFQRLAGTEGMSFTTGQTAFVDSGLAAGSVFYYRVSVVTASGESAQSPFSGATVQLDNRAPAAPTFVEGEPVVGEPDRLSVTWRAPTTDLTGAELTGVQRYLVYRSDTLTGRFGLVGTVTAPAFVDTGLTAATTYYYQVEAADAQGNVSPRSATAALTSGGVDMPTQVTLSASTPSDPTQSPVVTIRWTGSRGGILHYEVQRTTVANSTNDADYVDVLPNTLDTVRRDTGVTRGVTYYYRVRARDVDNRASEWTQPLPVDVAL